MSAQGATDEYLFDLYRRYVGEPEDRTDVYLGFGLFLGGIALAAVSLVLFLWSSSLEPRSAAYFTWVEPAYIVGMVSLPVLMMGIVVLLPSERRVLYASMGGLAITIAAAIGFWIAYPEDWLFGNDYTVVVVATYAVGLAAITASTGAALIAHYLDMAKQAGGIAQPGGDEDEPEESYTDEEIRSDIDDAMEGVELSWGGVERSDNTKLRFSDQEFEGAKISLEGKKTRSSGVDSQVAGLKGLKGGDKKTTTSSTTVDDQTQKLKELREKQRVEELATAPEDDLVSKLSESVTSVLRRIRTAIGRE